MANKTEWPKLPKLPKDVLARLAKCLALVPDRKLKPEEAPCVMGGKPPLPEGVAWPERDGELLTYVGRINTTVAHRIFEEVPDAGWLLFFHDPEDERLQTIIVTEELGEPKGPPKGSKYLVVDMRLGPDDGRVSSAAACRFVPAWSYTFDPDAELDEDVVDALDALKPEKAIGQLLGHAFFEEQYSREHAVEVAVGKSTRFSYETYSEAKLAAMRKRAQKIPPAPPTPQAYTFACPKLGRRLKAVVEELKVLEPEWKQRAKQKGKVWPSRLSTACKTLVEKHSATINLMVQGKELELKPIIAAFKTWESVFFELEYSEGDKRMGHLYEWSKELRAKQAQVGDLKRKQTKETKAEEEEDEMLKNIRSRLYAPILDRLIEASMTGKNFLETAQWAMKELEKIGDSVEVSEVTQVLDMVVKVLGGHEAKKQGRAEHVSLEEVDAIEAHQKWKKKMGKDGIAKAAKDWRMLLSFESRLDYCWSDSGSVRYFIEETKLAKGEFDRVVSDIESG